MAFVAPIVEGHAEVESLPALLHRLADHLGLPYPPRVYNPIRVKSGSFVNDHEYFNRHIRLAAARAVEYSGFVLILLDCDDDCPAKLGPQLLARAQAARGDAKFLVALAYREFETWFIAAAESLRGRFGLSADLGRPADFESIRGAKGWLGSRMPNGYDPVAHQLLMARAMDLNQAQAAKSFKRLAQRLRHFLQG